MSDVSALSLAPPRSEGVTVASFGGNGDFQIDAPGVVGGRLIVKESGQVGIGTATPVSQLHVVGDITVTGDVLLTGADCAEDFDVFGERALEPGTVVVIAKDGALRESGEAYDKTVAGVVSGVESTAMPRLGQALVGQGPRASSSGRQGLLQS